MMFGCFAEKLMDFIENNTGPCVYTTGWLKQSVKLEMEESHIKNEIN